MPDSLDSHQYNHDSRLGAWHQSDQWDTSSKITATDLWDLLDAELPCRPDSDEIHIPHQLDVETILFELTRYWELNRAIEIKERLSGSDEGKALLNNNHDALLQAAWKLFNIMVRSRYDLVGARQIHHAFLDSAAWLQVVLKHAWASFLQTIKQWKLDLAQAIYDTFLDSPAWTTMALKKAWVWLSCAIKEFDLPHAKDIITMFLDSVEWAQIVLEKASAHFLRLLDDWSIDLALEIQTNFLYSEDAQKRFNKQNVTIAQLFWKKMLDHLEHGEVIEAQAISDTHLDSDQGRKVKSSIYKLLLDRACKDNQVKQNFEFMEMSFGKKYIASTILSNVWFYGAIHDNLLWVEKIRIMPQLKQQAIISLLQSILHQAVSWSSHQVFGELDEYISYFDPDLYYSQGGTGISSWSEFKRQALLQKYNITIPPTISTTMQYTLQTLINAPGVDVPFLRMLLDASVKPHLNGKKKNTFVHRLHAIIDWSDTIDERQIIPPFKKIMDFDPLHKIVYEAIWFHSMNQDTAKYKIEMATNPLFKKIADVRKWAHSRVVSRLQHEKDQNIKKYPDKKAFYIAEYTKSLKHQWILVYDWAKIKWLRLSNTHSHLLDEDTVWSLQTSVQEIIFHNPWLIFMSLTKLLKRKDELVAHSQMHLFLPLIDVCNQFIGNIIWKPSHLLTNEEWEICAHKVVAEPWLLSNYFEDTFVLLSTYIMYLAFNNAHREANSKSLKKEVDSILKQSQYVAYNNNLMNNGHIPENQNATITYLKGLLPLSVIDDSRLRTILKKYGHKGEWRTMHVEILPKSDPRWWVCGDYTNSCMPLTSSKNQEYLLREDIAYFIISVVDQEWNEDLVAQSVLVAAHNGDSDPSHFTTLAIDNIEIANRALAYRPILAEWYKVLPQIFWDKKIIIWTSYNDDWWMITNWLSLESFSDRPLQWSMLYSDCFDRHNAYIYHDPKNSVSPYSYVYYGLCIDSIETSPLLPHISKETLQTIKPLLQSIGSWEDDWDWWFIFPDNYSTIITHNGDYVGYIIAADYLVDDEYDDRLTIERFAFARDITNHQQYLIIEEYIRRNNLLNTFKEIKLWTHVSPQIEEYFKTMWCNVTRL
jgi:hypothetical protein